MHKNVFFSKAIKLVGRHENEGSFNSGPGLWNEPVEDKERVAYVLLSDVL